MDAAAAVLGSAALLLAALTGCAPGTGGYGTDASVSATATAPASATSSAPAAPSPAATTASGAFTDVTSYPGLPTGVDANSTDPALGQFPQAFGDPAEPTALTVVTEGSSRCPDLPTGYSIGADGAVTITVAASSGADGSAACTADLQPTTSVVTVPGLAELPEEVTISIPDSGVLDTIVPVRPLPQ